MHTIREQPGVTDRVSAAEEKWGRVGEAWDILLWVIARDPLFGRVTTESGNVRTLTLEGARSIGLPSVMAVYEIHSEVVTIHEAEFFDAWHEEAGSA